eukprot:scaffold148027_cov18-Tisochrysis_lutea.AAC.1
MVPCSITHTYLVGQYEPHNEHDHGCCHDGWHEVGCNRVCNGLYWGFGCLRRRASTQSRSTAWPLATIE